MHGICHHTFQNKINRRPRYLLGVEVGVFKPDDVTQCLADDDTHDYFTAFVNVRSHKDWILSIIDQPLDQRSMGPRAIILCSFYEKIFVFSVILILHA